MHRRTLFKAIPGVVASGVALPRFAVAQSRAQRVLRFVPQANLSSLDPITTTAYVVRNHGYMAYDTLFGTDAGFVPRPQMAEGAVEEDDGRLWTVTLRDGLRFHDGERGPGAGRGGEPPALDEAQRHRAEAGSGHGGVVGRSTTGACASGCGGPSRCC